MKPRILIGGIFHETHTFLDDRTSLGNFAIRMGDEMGWARGDASILDGIYEFAESEGWQLLPTLDIRATPSAMVDDEVVEFFWSEFSQRVALHLKQGNAPDGIFLILHGAMASQSHPDVEGLILERLRAIPELKSIPLFGVFDLHANFSPKMAALTNGLVSYRENPHTDSRESGIRAAGLLARALREGTVPHMEHARAGILWPPTGTGTAESPMLDLEKLARSIEEKYPEVWAANVVAGFSFADTPDTGVSFQLITTGSKDQSQSILKELTDKAWELREKGLREDPPVDEVLEKVLPVREGPVVLVEPSDNIGGGAPGDGTGILRAFLKYHVSNAVVVINDPEAVEVLHDIRIGDHITLPIGGKGCAIDEGPIDLSVTLISTSDGKFTLEDKNSHLASMRGVNIDMGPSAVVSHAGIRILLTSLKTAPFDLGQLRSQGIIPEECSLIGVKAAVAHRRAYDKIAKQQFWVQTPGPCSNDVRSFPFTKIQHPIFPLDS